MHILCTNLFLRTSTSESILNSIIEWVEYHKQEEFNTVEARQQEKFQTLLDEKLSHKPEHQSSQKKRRTVVNPSNLVLSEEQLELLSLGLNFAVSEGYHCKN